MTTQPMGVPAMFYASKSDIVCAMIRELIISGELSESEPLRQRDLADRFGVSQTPVREALRRLESEGLVVNDPHRGATVAVSRNGIVQDNALIRAALEPLAVQLAAPALTERDFARLAALNEQMSEHTTDYSEYGPLNRQFHFAIYEAATSPVLLSMIRLLWQAMPTGPQVIRPLAESINQHREILASLVGGDAAKAAELTRVHIIGSEHLPHEIGRHR